MQMGLYIRDDGVNELADRLAKLTGTTKTQAVREALESRLSAVQPREPSETWYADLRARIAAAGIKHDPNWTEADEKAFMDDLSGGI